MGSIKKSKALLREQKGPSKHCVTPSNGSNYGREIDA